MERQAGARCSGNCSESPERRSPAAIFKTFSEISAQSEGSLNLINLRNKCQWRTAFRMLGVWFDMYLESFYAACFYIMSLGSLLYSSLSSFVPYFCCFWIFFIVLRLLEAHLAFLKWLFLAAFLFCVVILYVWGHFVSLRWFRDSLWSFLGDCHKHNLSLLWFYSLFWEYDCSHAVSLLMVFI